jgi:hypothetical protein
MSVYIFGVNLSLFGVCDWILAVVVRHSNKLIEIFAYAYVTVGLWAVE